MADISFFTPVKYENSPVSFEQKLMEKIDSYFYLGGRVAVLIPGSFQNGSQEVILREETTNFYLTALKVISYAVLTIIPVILLITKAVLRSKYRFHVCEAQPTLPRPHNQQPQLPVLHIDQPAPSVPYIKLPPESIIQQPIRDPIDQSRPSNSLPPEPLYPRKDDLIFDDDERRYQFLDFGVDSDGLMCKAPLTLVRCEKPTQLKISVVYNQKFVPQEPIVPKPSEITTQGKVSNYTWNVLTHDDGTMTTSSMNGLKERINMIWWEAIRKDVSTRIDPTHAACVKRSELKEFLEAILKKNGVQEKELKAFVHYWYEVFKNDYDSKNAPYVLVQPIKPSELDKYIPEMKIESEQPLALKRFYFRFEPVSQADQGINAESYLKQLQAIDLGPNVVIDMGGEVTNSLDVQVRERWDSNIFNASFIKDYIYA